MKVRLTKKFWKRLILVALVTPVLLFSITLTIVYWKQDQIVQNVIKTLNQDFEGEILIDGTHISPFANFPYISIDLENVRIYPNKTGKSRAIVHVKDAYVGFDLFSLIGGNIEFKAIKLNEGKINLIQYENGEFNIARALQSSEESTESTEELKLDLQKISLTNVDISKLNEGNGMLIDAFVHDGNLRFKTNDDHLLIGLKADFLLNVLHNGDSTYLKNKHFSVDISTDLDKITHIVEIDPSKIYLEDALFGMSGTMDIDDDVLLDLEFHGDKPDFDLFIAFAPEELIPTLKRYANEGKVYFDARLTGHAANGKFPMLDAKFGCENAYFKNSFNETKLDELQFKGHFHADDISDLSSMSFSISDISARPEAGLFKGNIIVNNFLAPEIDMQVDADFDLSFLAKFIELENLKKLRGKVNLKMNFHDIIDLENPERTLEQLNQAYYTELKVTNLGFESPDFHLPVEKVNIHASMKGEKAEIHHFDAKIGKSDLHIEGSVSNLPAILHHTDIPVTTTLKVTSNWLDLEELTKTKRNPDEFIAEQIEKFSVDIKFKSSAKAITESPSLPIGEFFIDNLYAKFKFYPHTLHDFHADVIINEQDFRVIDFSGEIDQSDFHFTGKLANYDLWFQEKPQGDTKIEFKIDSKKLILKDLLSYNGVNYLPEDYRNEVLSSFNLKGHADLHFKDSLHSSDIYLDNLTAKMNLHPLKLENFKGRFHVEDEHIIIQNFYGKMGHSSFTTHLNYYYGKDTKIRKRDNYFSIKAPRLDIDELTNYTPPKPNEPVEHDSVFNIYELPFTDMKFDVQIGQVNYHNYKLANLNANLRTTENHYIHIDKLDLEVAGGHISGTGYFNGSNPKAIYLTPDFTFKKLDLDQLMLKFDNFGQDEIVSDNLHGRISGRLTGKIHLHTDMVPIIDDSEIHLDFEVIDGRIDNYGPMHAIADYFQDKNLDRVAFDTLRNRIDMTNGNIKIPAMTINTTLGFLEVSGTQDKHNNMEYFVRVPMKMVTSIAANKLFGKKKEEIDPEQDDEIIRRDPEKKTKFINIKITGTPENYKIALGKDKDRIR